MKILIIEDDPILNKNIQNALHEEHFETNIAFDGLIAERYLKKTAYDCIIMDINLPGINGYELCKLFRSYNKNTPVLMLTAFSDIDDKIKGYECGADDYLTKPFFMKELLLRVKSLIKRNGLNNFNDNEIYIINDLIIEDNQKKVFRGKSEIILTPREYEILLTLVKQKGNIVSKNELVKQIWGSKLNFNTNIIEVYINFLRNKIDKPFNKNTIKTKPGFGYYIDPS